MINKIETLVVTLDILTSLKDVIIANTLNPIIPNSYPLLEWKVNAAAMNSESTAYIYIN
jgi:hypothetical protein